MRYLPPKRHRRFCRFLCQRVQARATSAGKDHCHNFFCHSFILPFTFPDWFEIGNGLTMRGASGLFFSAWQPFGAGLCGLAFPVQLPPPEPPCGGFLRAGLRRRSVPLCLGGGFLGFAAFSAFPACRRFLGCGSCLCLGGAGALLGPFSAFAGFRPWLRSSWPSSFPPSPPYLPPCGCALVGTSKYRVLMGGRVMVMLCSKPCSGFLWVRTDLL